MHPPCRHHTKNSLAHGGGQRPVSAGSARFWCHQPGSAYSPPPDSKFANIHSKVCSIPGTQVHIHGLIEEWPLIVEIIQDLHVLLLLGCDWDGFPSVISATARMKPPQSPKARAQPWHSMACEEGSSRSPIQVSLLKTLTPCLLCLSSPPGMGVSDESRKRMTI